MRKLIRYGVVLTVMLAGINGFSQTKKQCLDSIVNSDKSKLVFSYDNKGNETLLTIYDRKNIPSEQYEYTYNLSYSKTDLICPSDYLSNNMCTEKKWYSWNGKSWNTTPNCISTYYWSEQKITGIVETRHATSLQVYPNPTNGILHIVSAGATHALPVQIYDIYGRKIVNCQLSIVNSIDISHLANGLYFLKMGNKTTRFVKE